MGPLIPENSSKQDLDDSGYVQDASASENGSKGYAQLLDLSDDVLLYILQYLTPRDLKALGHTCPRLGILICDRTLWVKVDHRSWPVGEQRLRWLLTHGLCATTTELKLSGYANKYSRCLGIQDTLWPEEVDQNCIRGTCVGPQQDGSVDSVDVEHFLLRMWYPHLPRCLISPRWPDKTEVDRRKAKVEEERKKAAEAAASKSGEASISSGQNEGSLPPSSSSSTQNLSSIEDDSVKCDELPVSSSSDKLNQAGCSSENSSKSDQKPGCSSRNSGINTSNASQYSESSESKKEKNAFLFEDDNCKGPQFSLTMNLMKDLKKKCSHLTSLALEYCNLDYKTTNIRHFPIHLKKLSLRGSRCYNLPLNVSYLGKVQQRLPELEYLDVSECEWFEPASLMPLSKLPVLAELYMRDCRRLNECVAYASLSSRYGFKKLKVIDVRGSPLADSEVSALGWLPLLEELYMSPPDDFAGLSEHTHTWADINTVFTELDSWETEEPDYYKVKSPEPEHEEEDKEDETDNDRQGEVIFNNPWWAHERRIIVIQPNARQELEQRFPPRPRQPGNEEDENGPGEARQAPRERQPDPRPGPAEPQPGPAEPKPDLAEPKPDPAEPQPGPAEPQAGPAEPQPDPAEPQPGPANPRQAVLYPLPYQMGNIDIVPIGNPPKPLQDVLDEVLLPIAFNPRSLREDGWGPASPENPQPGLSNQEPGPSSPQPGPSSPQPGPSNAQPGPESSGEGTSKRRLAGDDAIDLAKRRRLVDDDEGEQPAQPPVEPVPAPAPANFPPYNPLLCRRFRIAEVPAAPENEPERPDLPGVRFRRHDLRHVMQIDVDIHRQSNITVSSHVGNQLVTDSSLLRLGRAENENVNYIHIGRYGVHHGSESGSRPDRSNLRILSVTGYRGITDRSLEHLVTAAPNLVYLDFTETNVTARGVEMFKAIKPDCEVIFSQFGRMM